MNSHSYIGIDSEEMFSYVKTLDQWIKHKEKQFDGLHKACSKIMMDLNKMPKSSPGYESQKELFNSFQKEMECLWPEIIKLKVEFQRHIVLCSGLHAIDLDLNDWPPKE
jgi:hypothetical protein